MTIFTWLDHSFMPSEFIIFNMINIFNFACSERITISKFSFAKFPFLAFANTWTTCAFPPKLLELWIVTKFPELSFLTIFNNCVSAQGPPLSWKLPPYCWLNKQQTLHLITGCQSGSMWCRPIFLLSAWQRQRTWQSCRLSRPPLSCWHPESDMACIRRSQWSWQECWEFYIPTCQDSERRHRWSLQDQSWRTGPEGKKGTVCYGLSYVIVTLRSFLMKLSLWFSRNFLGSASIFLHTPTQRAFVTVLYVKMCQRLGKSLLFCFTFVVY